MSNLQGLDDLIASDRVAEAAANRRRLLLAKRKILMSRENLLDFTQYLRPDPQKLWDPEASMYEISAHHALMAKELEGLERGDFNKLILSLPPRHGKSELASKSFIPWYLGRNPTHSTIMATYNSHFAGDFGRAVRGAIQDPRYGQVFPNLALKRGSTAAERLEVDGGGMLAFVGRGGSLTGRGGHLMLVDDPIKDRKEADSGLIRDQLWAWWNQVFKTRGMVDDVRILLIQTRWHEDDLIGRLTDPNNTHYNKKEADTWRVVNLPALAGDEDPLGRNPGEPLWPARFGSSYLAGLRDQDTRGFSALFQGEPAPDSGLFFNQTDIIEYQSMKEVPDGCRYYGASDHAISQAQWSDKSVFLIFAVDQEDNIWLMPDSTMHKLPSDQAVELMLALIKKHDPLFWWAEKGHISKAIGPFLRKRMVEEGVYTSIHELTPIHDKQSRAQSIKGRMAMGKVRFPAWAQWYQEARRQLLTFPAGAKDDFVDAMSMIGMGLGQQIAPRIAKKEGKFEPGTLGALKEETKRKTRLSNAERINKGW